MLLRVVFMANNIVFTPGSRGRQKPDRSLLFDCAALGCLVVQGEYKYETEKMQREAQRPKINATNKERSKYGTNAPAIRVRKDRAETAENNFALSATRQVSPKSNL